MSGNIIRVSKPDRYSVISHDMLRDKRLSFGARGLLAYLLSRPDNWVVRITDLIKQSPAGRDAVYGLLKELETYRYLRRERRPGNGGKFQWEITVYEEPYVWFDSPFTEKPEMVENSGNQPFPASPYTAKPDTAEPDTANPEHKKERTKVITKEELTRKELRKADGSRAAARSPAAKLTVNKMTDEQFMEFLKAEPAYSHIDLKVEAGKLRVWCAAHGKHPTRQRFINWLNRVERPLTTENGHGRKVAAGGGHDAGGRLSRAVPSDRRGYEVKTRIGG